MASSPTDLERWFDERPAWMQDAVRRLIQNGKLGSDDITQLVKLCKTEVGILEGENQSPNPISPVSVRFQQVPKKSTLRLLSLFDLKGINALAPRKPLLLDGAPLIVVYGLNASGKSGYIRVLKHASGQREPGSLHADVFSASNSEQSCKFSCKIDETVKELHWSFSDGPVNELRGLQIYDSNCASIYINEENEAAYEPFELSLFTQLTEACGRVGSALEAEINGKPSRKPAIPLALLTTQPAIWYGKLTHLTTQTEVSQKCQWTDQLEVELLTLNQRLIEANPSGKAADFRKQKDRLLNLHSELTGWGKKLGDESCALYYEALRDSKEKRRAADNDAKIVFANAPLEGVGSETWKLMWQQARAYSDQFAYKGVPFPNVEGDALCVLCQQPLGADAKQRLISFESFVMSGLETQAKLANTKLEQLFANLNGLPAGAALGLRMDSVGLAAEPDRSAVTTYCLSLEERRLALLKTDRVSQLPLAVAESILDFLKERAGQLEAQATSLDQDASGENRPLMEKRRDELVAMKWLSQQQASVQDEMKRLKLIYRLQEARRLTNTQPLSTKKSSLAETLITNAFIDRFQSELKMLGAGRIKAKLVKTRAERGHVFHEIRLQDPKSQVRASDVLSEGEFRIVSLAAFLADVELRGQGCPFIFDDPISSLGQVFEKATAQRLVELSKTRQVIVFTHRLSLLDHLDHAGGMVGPDALAVLSVRREPWGMGEPRNLGLGEVKPEGALDQLLQRLKQARDNLSQDGQAKYEEHARGICGDFRITIERVIEKILLCDVIRRHSREVTTKGKLKNLAKITDEDCALFDDLMTKYSTYEHSQPEEAPATLPQPDEITSDIKNVKEWIVAFKKRN